MEYNVIDHGGGYAEDDVEDRLPVEKLFQFVHSDASNLYYFSILDFVCQGEKKVVDRCTFVC